MLQGTVASQRQAKVLRQTMSPPEIALWMALRARPDGLKFRKQHPSGPFVADFYCHAARLIVEVDGAAHGHGNRPSRDATRDGWFTVRGIAVMRIAAADILRDTDAAVRGIVACATERLAALEG